MKRPEMLKKHRDTIASSYAIRAAMSKDIISHERTIQRWAVNNSPKLCADFVLKSFKKHAGIKGNEPLTEEVTITQAHELVA